MGGMSHGLDRHLPTSQARTLVGPVRHRRAIVLTGPTAVYAVAASRSPVGTWRPTLGAREVALNVGDLRGDPAPFRSSRRVVQRPCRLGRCLQLAGLVPGGFLFFPWTTLIYGLVYQNGLSLLNIIFLIAAFAIDLGTWGVGFFASRQQVSSYRGT